LAIAKVVNNCQIIVTYFDHNEGDEAQSMT
jgi:hypothetical protein